MCVCNENTLSILLVKFKHTLFVSVCVCVCVHMCSFAQLSLTRCDSIDFSPTSSSGHGVFPARILEWVAISCSRDVPDRNLTCISCVFCTGRQIRMVDYVQFSPVQFSSVAQSCLTLCDPMNCSTLGPLSTTIFRSSLKLMSIESVMPSSYLILCHPILLLPPILPAPEYFPMSQLFA